MFTNNEFIIYRSCMGKLTCFVCSLISFRSILSSFFKGLNFFLFVMLFFHLLKAMFDVGYETRLLLFSHILWITGLTTAYKPCGLLTIISGLLLSAWDSERVLNTENWSIQSPQMSRLLLSFTDHPLVDQLITVVYLFTNHFFTEFPLLLSSGYSIYTSTLHSLGTIKFFLTYSF